MKEVILGTPLCSEAKPMMLALCAAIVLAVAAAGAMAAESVPAVAKTLPNGDQIQYDGTYYDFRAANGRQMIKVWVPPAADPVRGLFISGHGGGSGDSRDFARDENMKALAARFGFGLAGLHTFPGRRTYDGYAKLFFDTLDEFAALGHHPELANVPFVMLGHSNGGATTWGMVNYAPERAICFTSNVSAWFNPETPNEGALAVPGILAVGQFDPFGREEEGVRRMAEVVTAARARGARWAMVAGEKGHEDGAIFDVYLKLVEQCIPLRYPPDADPRTGPVRLTDIPLEDGWLAAMDSWGSGITKIVPYADYEGDLSRAGWLPNADVAYVYRGEATWQNPLMIGVEEMDRVYNPHTDPGDMFSIGGPVVDPGRRLKLVCNAREMPEWTKIEFFNGSRRLGEANAPDDPVLTVEVPAEDIVWCLTAVGHSAAGDLRTAAPLYFTVRDPSLELRSEAEKARDPDYVDEVGIVGSKTSLEAPAGYVPRADAVAENVLLAYGLTAAQEETFAAEPNAVSAFWAAMGDDADSIRMLPRTHAREGDQFSIVTTADARMKVRAAHSARGLYLCFEVMDNRFVPAGETPGDYINRDAIDVLLDSKSSAEIHEPDNATQAICADWDLYLTTKQYQVAFGYPDPPAIMKRVVPDPWDMVFNRITPIAELARVHGMQIHYAKIDSLRRVQEWFIPWSEVGRASEPAVGTRLAFAPAYNDTDPGTGRKQLCWIGHSSPWVFSARSEDLPRGWGDIEIGPMIGTTPDGP
jgi:pimeloyl-ACP methyl ester carboxylesterase